MQYISPSKATLHTIDVGLQRSETQNPAYVYSCNNLHYTFLPVRLLCTPTYVYWCNLHYTFLPARLLYTAIDARLQRGETHSPTYVYRCNNLCCTFLPTRLLCTPQMLDYKGAKYIAPHIASATTYAVHFFQ